jgi:RNA polymerase sigma-70 factor (ECF subfamily)
VDNKTESKLTDRHLVERVLRGDTNTFAFIIKNTEKLVAQIVFKMINNAEDRKDIAQDIYLKVYTKLPSFQFQSKLSTWIAQVGYNTCLDHLRKKKLVLYGDINEDYETGDDMPDMLNNFIPQQSNGTATMLQQKEHAVIIKNEMEKLPPLYKTLISLYHHEELSYEELGQITGLPDGTIKSYLFRARKLLKNNLLLNYKKEDL